MKKNLLLTYLIMMFGLCDGLFAQPQHKRPKWDYNFVYCYDISTIKRPISTFELLPSDVALGGTENVFTPVGKLSLGLGINGRLLLH
ncbi:MAG: hypothetical protein ACKVTZ_00425, partial [Bacteroidia bacterium]